MPNPRYTVTGIPPALASSAFLPNFTRRAGSGAQSYKYAVDGSPGTRGVPAPRPQTSRDGDVTARAQYGYAGSQDAPPAWFPQEWFQGFICERPGAGMPVRVYDPVHPGPTTLLPVPAVDYRTVYLENSARLSRPGPRAGQRAVRARPRLPRWRDRNSG